MKKFRKANIKRIISAAVVSALIASGVGYTFVSSAANTITLASSGRFEYDADGNGTINGAAGDIILDSDDLVALKDAVTGLNSSLTAISTKAYGADGVPNYTGQLKDASGNLISGDPDDLESKYYSYQTSHSYTNTQYSDYGTKRYNEGNAAGKAGLSNFTNGCVNVNTDAPTAIGYIPASGGSSYSYSGKFYDYVTGATLGTDENPVTLSGNLYGEGLYLVGYKSFKEGTCSYCYIIAVWNRYYSSSHGMYVFKTFTSDPFTISPSSVAKDPIFTQGYWQFNSDNSSLSYNNCKTNCTQFIRNLQNVDTSRSTYTTRFGLNTGSGVKYFAYTDANYGNVGTYNGVAIYKISSTQSGITEFAEYYSNGAVNNGVTVSLFRLKRE